MLSIVSTAMKSSMIHLSRQQAYARYFRAKLLMFLTCR
jgi:hypothetical protein